MRTNQPLGTVLKKAGLSAALLCLLLIGMGNAYAQQSTVPKNVYTPLVNATGSGRALTVSSANGLGTLWGIANNTPNNAINNSTTDFARLNILASLGSLTTSWLEVRDPNANSTGTYYPAGSYAGFVIGDFGVLDLRNKVTVATYMGGTQVEYRTMDGAALAVSLLSGGKSKVGFVTTQPFNRIRITFDVIGVASSRDVYYAEVLVPQAGPTPACNITTALTQDTDPSTRLNSSYPAVVTTGTGGLSVGVLNSVFTNIGNVVSDTKPGGPATINGTVLIGLGDSAYISVREAGVGNFRPAGYFAGFEVSDGSGNLAQIGLLKNTVIATYLDGNFQESVSSDNLLLSAPVLSGSGKTTVGFVTKKNFNEIRYIRKNVVGVNLLSAVNVYNAVIKRFCEGTALNCNTLTPLSSEEYPVYIDATKTGTSGVADVNLLSNGTNYDAILDGNPNTAATLDFTLTALSSHRVAVAKAISPSYTKGTFVGFNLGVNTFVSVDVLSQMTIRLYKREVNGTLTEVQSATGTPLLAGVTTGILPGVLGSPSGSVLPIGVVATADFDEVQLEINKPVNLNVLSKMYIYDFVMQNNCAKVVTCSTSTTMITSGPGNYDVLIDGMNTGFSGLVSGVGSIENPGNIINTDLTDHASIKVVANVAASGAIRVMAGKSVFPKGVFAGFLVRENSPGLSPLVLVNLLKTMRVNLFYRDPNTGVRTQVGTAGNGQLLGLTALIPILGNDHGTKLVGLTAPADFNEIEIAAYGIADVGLPRTLEIFGFAIDTRYSSGTGGGLSCPLYKTNPDINYTTVNKPVDGNVSSNDLMPSGTNYPQFRETVGADAQPNPAGGGTLALKNDGSGEYTFTATITGVYSYDVQVCNSGNCEWQNLTITVTDPSKTDNLPIVNTDIAVTKVGIPVTVNVLVNDHAGNKGGTLGDPVVDKQGSNGSAALSPDGKKVVYTPGTGFIGKDTVVYKVTETPANKTGFAFIIIETLPTEVSATSATDDFAMTDAGTVIDGTVNVKDNDVDPAGLSQAVEVFTKDDERGKFELRSDGTFKFTPAIGYTGTAQYVYTTTNTAGASAKATVFVAVGAGDVDLSLSLKLSPTQIEGAQVGYLIVTVYNQSQVTADKEIKVMIPASNRISEFTFEPSVTIVNSVTVENAKWEFVGLENGFYVLRRKEALGASSSSSIVSSKFGVSFRYTSPSSGGGKDNIVGDLYYNSTIDANGQNNSDSESLNYRNAQQ